ncbi:hypothetical protein ElyMa_005710000 [Elysia marginata]|uniref:Uncharacterized protein n=1 Tax=Elysia marginata TaxID=1093978 RepID=A0AAV4FGQ2_9GAST|nr:hypothetical protein ElyMa_005710000 [Elysia marginata]
MDQARCGASVQTTHRGENSNRVPPPYAATFPPLNTQTNKWAACVSLESALGAYIAQLVVASLRGQEVAGSSLSRAQSGPLLVGSVSV